MQRRDFTKMLGIGALAVQTLPIFASGRTYESSLTGGLKAPLGICNHSLRSMRLTARQLVEYAIQEKLDSVLLNTFQPLDTLATKYLSELRKYANSNDVSIYIGAGGISDKSTIYSDKYGRPEELLKEGIRVASTLGSPIVACRIGNINDRYVDGGIEAQMEAVIGVMKSLKSHARDAGVKFAFENHAGDLRTTELLTIIEETGNDVCGALFDPANALWAMEDPLEALTQLGSVIIATSVRDVVIWPTNEGANFQWTAIGEGMMDYPLYVNTMAELCPGVPIHVETISNDNRSLPFLNADFWKGFPDLPASDMVNFLKLVKKGQPMEIIEAPAGTSKKDFDIQLQKEELTKSLRFLRENCNAGLKA